MFAARVFVLANLLAKSSAMETLSGPVARGQPPAPIGLNKGLIVPCGRDFEMDKGSKYVVADGAFAKPCNVDLIQSTVAIGHQGKLLITDGGDYLIRNTKITSGNYAVFYGAGNIDIHHSKIDYTTSGLSYSAASLWFHGDLRVQNASIVLQPQSRIWFILPVPILLSGSINMGEQARFELHATTELGKTTLHGLIHVGTRAHLAINTNRFQLEPQKSLKLDSHSAFGIYSQLRIGSSVYIGEYSHVQLKMGKDVQCDINRPLEIPSFTKVVWNTIESTLPYNYSIQCTTRSSSAGKRDLYF